MAEYDFGDFPDLPKTSTETGQKGNSSPQEDYSHEFERPDRRSGKLGQELSYLEEKVYRVIYLHGEQPVSTEKLAKTFYGSSDPDDKNAVWDTIARLRSKLGTHSIVCEGGRGYTASRAVIESRVDENIENNS